MNMNQLNTVSHMTQNEDFDIISRTAVVNNDDNNIIEEEINMEHVFEEDGIEDESETQREKDKAVDCNIEIPSIYTNLDEKSLHVDNNWLKSYSKSKNDFALELGKDSFNNKEEFIRAIKLYFIKTHKHFEVVESRPTIWSIRCKLHEQGCKWTLRGSKRERSGLFEISKYTGPHTCLHYKISQDHPNLDSSVIAQEIQHLIKAEPSTSITVLRAEIIDKLGYTPTYKKVWVGKQKAIEHVFGDWDESYNILPKFLMALQTFNPGTIVEWCVLEETGQDQVEFRRVFWAFDPSIKGFKHCRPVISIDGTHLYGKYKGKMMIAMGVDGNNQILPLAFAIVENESFASWNWFLSHIKRHVVKDVDGICLISDRHPGILKVVNEQGSPWLESRGYHRYCLRHFINNFNDKFRSSQLKTLAYRAGSQNQIQFSPIPHEAYRPQAPNIALLPNSELKRDKRGPPRSTRLRNGMDIKEGKKSTNCGICGERGHNRATCITKPKKVNA
uniref:uncharacterized protein LOC122604809 n=1 Tax=Erigeron canadensis TaxID=72917 RepID=UPI001CB8DA6C|nr:uncharacterized protein LOC122604809 [Erigeron canadensis]